MSVKGTHSCSQRHLVVSSELYVSPEKSATGRLWRMIFVAGCMLALYCCGTQFQSLLIDTLDFEATTAQTQSGDSSTIQAMGRILAAIVLFLWGVAFASFLYCVMKDNAEWEELSDLVSHGRRLSSISLIVCCFLLWGCWIAYPISLGTHTTDQRTESVFISAVTCLVLHFAVTQFATTLFIMVSGLFATRPYARTTEHRWTPWQKWALGLVRTTLMSMFLALAAVALLSTILLALASKLVGGIVGSAFYSLWKFVDWLWAL